MLRLRGDDTDALALFEYLKSVPPKHNKVNRPAQIPAAKLDLKEATPETLFASFGCVNCHGPEGRFHEKLAQAKGKSVQQVAAWIRNAEATKPGTPMPTYAEFIDEGTALRLAAWIQDEKNGPLKAK